MLTSGYKIQGFTLPLKLFYIVCRSNTITQVSCNMKIWYQAPECLLQKAFGHVYLLTAEAMPPAPIGPGRFPATAAAWAAEAACELATCCFIWWWHWRRSNTWNTDQSQKILTLTLLVHLYITMHSCYDSTGTGILCSKQFVYNWYHNRRFGCGKMNINIYQKNRERRKIKAAGGSQSLTLI